MYQEEDYDDTVGCNCPDCRGDAGDPEDDFEFWDDPIYDDPIDDDWS